MITSYKVLSIVFGCFFVLPFNVDLYKEPPKALKTYYTFSGLQISPCRPDVDRARKIIENFLTNPDLSDRRAETGTTGLNISQIQLLDDFSDANACQEFDDEYSQTIAKTSGPNNDRTYDVVYYKAGNFYFVVVVLAPPSDPDVVSVGLSHIMIHDQNLDYIAGYSG